MKLRERLVVDTNAFVSRLLLPSSIPAQAVRKAIDRGQLLVSDATMNELADVLSRKKFDAYVTLEEREHFIRLLGRIVEFVPIVQKIHVCRDPKDDWILEVAVNGSADLIVTGDRDLLSLERFRNTPIVSPAAYLKH
jgi:putative PIN family toxin of toxin-antitoxin system